MRVLSVASEAVPFVKTGGLADVAGALPGALAPHGVAVSTLIPGYRDVIAQLGKRPRTALPTPSLGRPLTLVDAGPRTIAVEPSLSSTQEIRYMVKV